MPKQSRVLAIIFNNFGPYHLARLKAAQCLGQRYGIRVLGLELASEEKIYPWKVEGQIMGKITLFSNQVVEEISAPRYIYQTWRTLNMIRPDSLLISGYVHPAMLTALCWAKVNGKCAVLMFDSKADDKPRWALKEWCKSLIVGRFDAALGGGKAHAAYAISLGLPPHRVFSGVDVVDNEFFWRNAQGVRRQEEQTRIRLGLPRPFFLSVCRFIPKKNLFRLIKAYRLYLKIVSSPPWDLVLCGSGPQEPALRQEAANLSGVHFPGFKQSEELPAYYGLADCFILASSEFEQWGLVVNEAMACGLPVLVSKACGCAQDLVQDGLNGYVFDPHNVVELAGLLHKMSSGETDLTSMGKASRRIIAHWTLETFAENMLKAIRVANVD